MERFAINWSFNTIKQTFKNIYMNIILIFIFYVPAVIGSLSL